jgi:hypothetical protein
MNDQEGRSLGRLEKIIEVLDSCMLLDHTATRGSIATWSERGDPEAAIRRAGKR